MVAAASAIAVAAAVSEVADCRIVQPTLVTPPVMLLASLP